ncbi:iron-sulfur cluster assembly ATPase SufC [Paucilactobacillus hokkaidonensis JCM 18461]|uniref:Iron-sulfur cluster assembly ATPase SufC n=2 Tax=Paucilactobacillus hokkaidonensis TaxID=1193095 RepID=A0A0A1GSL2_9LACO|nr:Fe-S cluster assembly ATPase SufC [Paucilactobacillus hokkaidonensis]KRO09318.1 feS assembly ATPase SufC [Paucilactobacillus hokkaidonensis]BAP85267.1 iron-sulfur cluster assembly ATPase SufC [Paucilactobacillus hokkaidonensis JCM 18461]
MTLEIRNLHAIIKATDQEILSGINLTIPDGEVHAIMGPNGTGKSTLAQTIMGYPAYQVTAGSIKFDGHDVLQQSVDQRAKLGLFLGMQYPAEISGVNNADFLRAAMHATAPNNQISVLKFMQQLENNMNYLEMDAEIAERYLNVGFSGGEKKRNEILQMMMLQPKLAILDEIDSGLDIDALKVVSKGINHLRSKKFSALLITHYERLLEYVVPDVVHIMVAGKIVKSGGPQLAQQLEQSGYHQFEVAKELN